MSVSPDDRSQATAEFRPEALAEPRPAPWWRRGLVAFGRFWWEFLVGDTPELLVGSLAAIGAAALLAHHVGARAVVVGALPVLVVGILALSAYRARARSRSARDGGASASDGNASP